ncbi:PspC domain-containing protein [Fodinicola feengrottensis]|uniref:PspC domain-containing protein n=1 Tax=Fodinicola feengrottensis TaxID=435914 RepID=UPI0013D3541B|nr:PspC domain-containing protein [Fodinicola feengrottensis]
MDRPVSGDHGCHGQQYAPPASRPTRPAAFRTARAGNTTPGPGTPFGPGNQPGGPPPRPPYTGPFPRPGSFSDRVKITRPREGRLFFGVCAGLGRATGTDPLLFRVILGGALLLQRHRRALLRGRHARTGG